jgi:hypothetical protein
MLFSVGCFLKMARLHSWPLLVKRFVIAQLAPIEDDLLLFLVAHLELLSDVLLPKGIEDDLGRDCRHISLVKRPPLIMDNEGLLINYLTKGANTVSFLSRHLENDLEDAREIERGGRA